MNRGHLYLAIGIVLTLLVAFQLYVAVEFLATKDYFSGLLLVISAGLTLRGAVEFGKLAVVPIS